MIPTNTALRSRRRESVHASHRERAAPQSYCKTTYKQRHKIENMFGSLKDWRRNVHRYDRRADVFMAAITLAAIVIWWLQ